VRVHHPELDLCTDNGAMIALAAAMRVQRDRAGSGGEVGSVDVKPRWDLAEIDRRP
jgi:N6-L-threonylcarbamoyladenine synthase